MQKSELMYDRFLTPRSSIARDISIYLLEQLARHRYIRPFIILPLSSHIFLLLLNLKSFSIKIILLEITRFHIDLSFLSFFFLFKFLSKISRKEKSPDLYRSSVVNIARN